MKKNTFSRRPSLREKGYLATSADDIADAVKINKSSNYYYYYYFLNKATILYEIASMIMRSLLNQAVSIA